MKGAPIENAMAAARAFLAERKADLPVAIVVFGPDDNVLSEFTTDGGQLAAAVAETPATSEGTHIYDALIKVADMANEQGLERTTVVLLSDGTDIGSSASRAEALQAAEDQNLRVISVGLSSPQYDPETLKSLANRTSGAYVETATPSRAQADLPRDRAAALERVRGGVPLAAPARAQGTRGRQGRRVQAGDRDLHDADPRPRAAGDVRAELDRRASSRLRG